MENSQRPEAELISKKKINIMCYHDMKKLDPVDKNCTNLLACYIIKNMKYA